MSKKKSSKIWLVVAIVALLAVVLFYTCPSREQHTEVLTDKIAVAVNHQFTKNAGDDNPFTSVLAASVVNGLVKMVVPQFVYYDNYGVLSVCYLLEDDEKKVVSVGLAGRVFTASESRFDELAEQNFSNFTRRDTE